jgi:excisionase family DNA binding protein
LSRKVNVVDLTERWVSVDEVARHLGIKRDTLYKWIKRTDIPAHKVGRLWKFKLSEVDLWARSTSESTSDDE